MRRIRCHGNETRGATRDGGHRHLQARAEYNGFYGIYRLRYTHRRGFLLRRIEILYLYLDVTVPGPESYTLVSVKVIQKMALA